MKNLKHADELLRQIAEGMKHHEGVRVMHLRVTFSNRFLGAKQDRFTFPLIFALDAIARDLYWDESGNWSECDTATVDTF